MFRISNTKMLVGDGGSVIHWVIIVYNALKTINLIDSSLKTAKLMIFMVATKQGY